MNLSWQTSHLPVVTTSRRAKEVPGALPLALVAYSSAAGLTLADGACTTSTGPASALAV